MQQLTDAWEPLRYHAQQAKLWRSSARFVAVAAGRGSGKTELAKRRVVRWLPVKKNWSDPKYFYALPTLPQARRIAWDQILKLVPPTWIREVNKTELRITTVFGSSLLVVGMDRPQRMEGVQWDGGVLDEACDQKPTVFHKTILPACMHRNAWVWQIGVPKRFGIGAPAFKKFYDREAEESYNWPSQDILTAEQLAEARELMDAKDFEEQFGATWQNASGQIFHAFSDENLWEGAVYNPALRIVVGSDFNVSPMAWVLGHFIPLIYPDGEIREAFIIFDEIFKKDTNTEATLNYLYSKYGKHANGWSFYGDATAKARKTSASTTDYFQIKNDKRFKNSKCFYPPSNPFFVDRVASCNSLLRNANGIIRTFIHPDCIHLIEDLQSRPWKEGKREADDTGDLGHITDAFGYPVHYRFPYRLDAKMSMGSVLLQKY